MKLMVFRVWVRPNALGEGGLQIINKDGGQYSPRKYNIKNATKKGIVYPPKDPSVFEIKFPDIDIRGRVVPFILEVKHDL